VLIMKTLEAEINKILTKWNPIGVPLAIAESEYTSYIPKIIKIYREGKSIYEYLKVVYTEYMEYDLSKGAEVDIKKASDQILQILQTVSV
jgi:hypothetical protein